MNDDFDWEDSDLIHVAPDVCMYTNSHDDIVVRKRMEYPMEDDDPFIVIPLDSGPRLIAAVLELLKQQRHQTVTVLQPSVGSKETETVIRVPLLFQDHRSD